MCGSLRNVHEKYNVGSRNTEQVGEKLKTQNALKDCTCFKIICFLIPFLGTLSKQFEVGMLKKFHAKKKLA